MVVRWFHARTSHVYIDRINEEEMNPDVQYGRGLVKACETPCKAQRSRTTRTQRCRSICWKKKAVARTAAVRTPRTAYQRMMVSTDDAAGRCSPAAAQACCVSAAAQQQAGSVVCKYNTGRVHARHACRSRKERCACSAARQRRLAPGETNRLIETNVTSRRTFSVVHRAAARAARRSARCAARRRRQSVPAQPAGLSR